MLNYILQGQKEPQYTFRGDTILRLCVWRERIKKMNVPTGVAENQGFQGSQCEEKWYTCEEHEAT